MKTIHTMITVAMLMLFMSCEKIEFVEEPERDPEALFEHLWNSFQTDYAGFEIREVDWQLQYDTFRPLVSANTTDEELISIIKQLLRTLDDAHVHFSVPNKKVFASNLVYDQGIGRELLDKNLIKDHYMKGEFKETHYGANLYGQIGNVGYLYLGWFRENILEMNNILDSFKNSDGMILDLRANDGGDFTYVLTEFGRLTDENRFVFRSRTKNGTGKNDYSDWYDWYLSPAGDYFDKPIVVLTDGLTVSAGERALLVLETLPNVTILGDTTNGAFSTKISKELANGWNYSLAPQHVESAEGINFEGSGFPPDIFLVNTEEEILNGQDRVLEEALRIINQL